MGHTSISALSQAAETAQHWVNELAADLNWDERRSYRLLRTVLPTLRDWLSPEEVADLAAQLPVLVRGIYFEGWTPQEGYLPDRSKQQFVSRVQAAFTDDALEDPDAAISAVFRLLDRHISAGEAVQVRNSMKKALRRMWPAH
jgi:uncharacterized protein (DUF2267 family)